MERIDPGVIFNDDDLNQADFEIAFTALVVTTTFALPVDDSGYTLLKGLVISLGVLTLIRKMAVSNKHRNPEWVLRWTMPIILAITSIAFVHILLELSSTIVAATNAPISPVIVAALFIPLFVLAVFVLHEWVFHDSNIYFALLCYNTAVRAEHMDFFGLEGEFRDKFLDEGSKFITFSKSESIPPELAWLQHRVEVEASPALTPLLIIGLIGYGTVWIVVSWVFGAGVLNVVFLIFVFMMNYPIQFWYSRFGLGEFMSERSGWVEVVIVFLGLIVANLTVLPRYM